jgi:hypothetical protein
MQEAGILIASHYGDRLLPVIPEKPSDIDAAWLAEVLQVDSSDVLNISVRSAEAESGLVSLICFVEIISKQGSGLPEKLVVKLAPSFEAARELVKAFNLFAREAQFYENIAPKLTIRTPGFLHCDYDESGIGVLVLEDCSHLRSLDQTVEQPTTLEELKWLVDMLANMAISSWNAPWLDTETELLSVDHPVSKAYFGGCQDGYSTLLESEFMEWAPEGFMPLAERLASDFVSLVEAQPVDKRSLCHLDVRLANIFLDDGADDPVILYDWQSMYPGRTAQDLGYLISSCYSADFRRTHERDLVKRYHQKLVEAGISDYSFDEAWFDYRHGIIIGLRLLPMAQGDLDLSSDAGNSLFRKLFQVLPRAVIDHGGLALIDEILVARK